MTETPGEVLWCPDQARTEDSEFTRFVTWLTTSGLVTPGTIDDYHALWHWSVTDPNAFWRAFADYIGIVVDTPDGEPVVPDTMPGGRWFPGTTVNYASYALADHDNADEAIVAIDEDGTTTTTTWHELRRQVGALAAFLRQSGVQHGDRVVAILPNRTEAVVGFLAAASVGAVWSIVAPEFGVGAIVSRLQQLEPVVLIAASGYTYGGRRLDRSDVLADIVAQLPSLREIVWVDTAAGVPATSMRTHSWQDVVAAEPEWEADQLPFDHPLWVLFSSGTTGIPKGIVHGHGGVVLEHLKTLTLHADLRPGDKLFVVGTTSWVVWNMLVSGLLRGATIVLLDGNPAHPDIDRVWRVAAENKVTMLGLGAAYTHASMRAQLRPGTDHDLSALRMIQVTGSPLAPDAFRWVYDAVGPVWLASVSGGTDIAGIFLGGAPTEPVRLGRLQPPALGVAAAAWDTAGHPVVGQPGELVITSPMPSMPLYFWNDPDGSRYRESYFSTYAGVWRHGDLVEFDTDRSSVIVGRSDSTLNRNGIRMGPADLYRVVEALPEVEEALVVGVEETDGYYMPMFVQLHTGTDPEAAITAIRNAIRAALSPRYVPDDIIVVSRIPHTRTGKKLEVPVKRILLGHSVDQVVDPGSVDDAQVLTEIRDRTIRQRQVSVP
ncbi:acetoacetate--CoA ligase [Rhodococcus sp. IEGM 1305]|uniref:acetoacetate--CoA ligase n=1 Tax=Rhodococcus sp. IEGM 1305 TaxID=3047092 RepID=UPI0024B82CD7|nr:acetoacetate--CoA ligase [Rhodococcus sp. IEGM 1305]MDI9948927.1 acetoacetate--CoA ligase [Rhodococcus sp. IEGM 1305]